MTSQSNQKNNQIADKIQTMPVKAFSEFAQEARERQFADKDHEVSVDETVVDQVVDFIDAETDNKLNFIKVVSANDS